MVRSTYKNKSLYTEEMTEEFVCLKMLARVLSIAYPYLFLSDLRLIATTLFLIVLFVFFFDRAERMNCGSIVFNLLIEVVNVLLIA